MSNTALIGTPSLPAPAEGWYPDPVDNRRIRWWDGRGWTAHEQPAPWTATPETARRPLGDNQRFQIRLTRVTSLVVLSQKRSQNYLGSFEELEKQYRSAQVHNLLVGWWGVPFGLIWNVLSLINNYRSWSRIRQLAGR